MKKFLTIAIFIFLGIIAIATRVNAAEVSTLEELKSALEDGGEITLTDDITSNEMISISKEVLIDGNNHTISVAGNIDGLEIETAEKVEINNLTIDSCTNSILTVDNTKIQVAGYEGQYNVTCAGNGNHYRGISLWELTNSTVTIKNSTIQGFEYNINLAGVNRSFSGTVVNIENSNFKGRTAINSHVENYTLNIKNSNILGINNYAGSQESFADIVLDSTSNNVKLNIVNVKCTNYQNETGLNNPNALQFMLALRGSDNVVKISGNTTFKDTTKKLELMWNNNQYEEIKKQLLENISKLENTTIPFMMQYTIAMKEILINQESDVVR